MSFRFYHIINALSLDVALGAGVLSLVLGRYLGLKVPVLILLILVLTVWSIYTTDHLFDAKSIKAQASSFRHHFHQHFYRQIRIALAFVAAGIIFLVTQIPPITVLYGFPVILAVFAYFILNRFFNMSFQKEILIAVLYVIGIFIGPYSLAEGNVPDEIYYLLVQLGILAWINLLVFGVYEIDHDMQDGLKSTVVVLGLEKTAFMIKTLLILSFSIGIMGLVLFYGYSAYTKLQIVFLFMTGVLGTLFFRRETLSQQGLQYRYFGDGIFFMPVAYLWF